MSYDLLHHGSPQDPAHSPGHPAHQEPATQGPRYPISPLPISPYLGESGFATSLGSPRLRVTAARPMAGPISLDLPPLQLTDDAPRRPPVIAAGVISMIATAFLGLFTALIAAVALHRFDRSFPTAVAPIGASDHFVGQVSTTFRTVLIFVAVMSTIMSTVLILLTVGVLRANRGARMGVWTLCAFGAAWGVAVLVGMILARSMMPMQSGEITAAAVVQTAEESVPGWVPGVLGFLGFAQALGYVAAAILLAVPATGPYFRSVLRPWRPQEWPERPGVESPSLSPAPGGRVSAGRLAGTWPG